MKFGSVKVNRAGFKTIRFKNANSIPITITSIQVTKNTAEFVPLIAANGCVSTLPPNSTCALEVAFTPKERRAYSSVLAITDDAAGSPQKIKLSGTGK